MYLYGASGHAKVVIDILENSGIDITGLFDDNNSIKELLGYKCIKYSKDVVLNDKFIITIGNNKIRKLIVKKLGSVDYGYAIDLSSYISKRAKVGQGSVVMPGARVNSCTCIGKHNIINTNSSVDHDCVLEDYVHISPGAFIAGGANIGEGTQVGIGACVIQNIKIGKWCVIGAGAVIINDIPDYSVVVGNPGRITKKIR